METDTDSLDITQLERSASATLEIAQRAKELERLVNATFPGYRVFIERRTTSGARNNGESANLSPTDFKDMSGVKQIETILRETRVPIKKLALLAALRDRGSKMNLDTLTSYLSRYPQFINRGHGIWGLPEKYYSSGTEVPLEEIGF